MKSIALIIFMLGCTAFAKAQGNLQFSQVHTRTGTVTAAAYSNSPSSTSYTVPAGKVWKIEVAGFNGSATSFRGYFHLNSLAVMSLGGAGGQINTSPIWVKAGDVIAFSFYNSQNVTLSCDYLFSIIEFNIIP